MRRGDPFWNSEKDGKSMTRGLTHHLSQLVCRPFASVRWYTPRDFFQKSAQGDNMPTQQKSETTPPSFLDDPNLAKKHRTQLREIESERERVHQKLADSERLSEADFAIRINARD